MDDLVFPSGPWKGFYTYDTLPGRHPMELQLLFKEGVIGGDGTDDIGPFVIQGQYDAGVGSARWTKSYTGSHDVNYEGRLDGTGLHGTWIIPPLSHGAFRLWPRHLGNGEHG